MKMRAVLAAVAATLLLDGVSVAGESPYNPNAKSRGPLRGWCWEVFAQGSEVAFSGAANCDFQVLPSSRPPAG